MKRIVAIIAAGLLLAVVFFALILWIQPRTPAVTGISPRELPESWICAVLVVRDTNFYEHRGRGFLDRSPERGVGLLRSISSLMGPRVSKEDELRTFLNNAYLGTFGGHEIHGFPAASRVLFKKELRALSGNEFLSLVAMLPQPNALDPIRHPDRNAARVISILELMQTRCNCSAPRKGYGAPCS